MSEESPLLFIKAPSAGPIMGPASGALKRKWKWKSYLVPVGLQTMEVAALVSSME